MGSCVQQCDCNAGSPRWTRSRRGTPIVFVPLFTSAPIHREPRCQTGSRKSYVRLDFPLRRHYRHRPHVAALSSVPSPGSDTAAATVQCACVQVPWAHDPRGGDARLVSRRGVLLPGSHSYHQWPPLHAPPVAALTPTLARLAPPRPDNLEALLRAFPSGSGSSGRVNYAAFARRVDDALALLQAWAHRSS